MASGEATLVAAVRGRVDRNEAVAAFRSGVPGGVRWLMHGPLRSVAQIYLPFRLHEVTIRRGRRSQRMVIGIDAVAGVLDLYRFDQARPSQTVVQVRTRNHLEAVVPSSAAGAIVASRVQRMMYQRVGFLAIGACRLDVQPVGEVLYVPYWLGFFGRRETVSLVVMDAVRRQLEGVKVRRLVERWITESPVA